MKKISLKKQKVMSLNSKELDNVKGGGIGRSNRRNGNCRYSDANAIDVAHDCGDGNNDITRVGCAVCL